MLAIDGNLLGEWQFITVASIENAGEDEEERRHDDFGDWLDNQVSELFKLAQLVCLRLTTHQTPYSTGTS